MRPGQQNKRGRGRGGSNNNNGGGGNNFNRKGGNPLTRTYDSSGPDVKIRGTAQHIAEKYSTLARDAQSAGDRVMAENYLQHAEHYYRIIAAAQAQMQERFQRDERNEFQDRDNQDIDDNETNDLDDEAGERQQPARETQQPQRREQQQRDQQRQNRREQPTAAEAAPALDGSGPQPVIEGTPAEVAAEEEAQVPAAAQERQPRRRNAGNRPRRPRRGEGEAPAEGEAPEGQPQMAEVAGE
ncbi:MAG TPA: DUF4167 domain-containing protein [Pseudorhizobium sp.]|nr:DUF4167 domain-containing protein [Pseudorhizobium sp.]